MLMLQHMMLQHMMLQHMMLQPREDTLSYQFLIYKIQQLNPMKSKCKRTLRSGVFPVRGDIFLRMLQMCRRSGLGPTVSSRKQRESPRYTPGLVPYQNYAENNIQLRTLAYVVFGVILIRCQPWYTLPAETHCRPAPWVFYLPEGLFGIQGIPKSIR